MSCVYREAEGSTFMNAPPQIMEGLAGQRQPFLDCPMHCRISRVPLRAAAYARYRDNPPANFQSTSWGGVTMPPFKSHHSRNPRDLLHPERRTCWDAGQRWSCGVMVWCHFSPPHPFNTCVCVCLLRLGAGDPGVSGTSHSPCLRGASPPAAL